MSPTHYGDTEQRGHTLIERTSALTHRFAYVKQAAANHFALVDE
jgi:hypothetical protein